MLDLIHPNIHPILVHFAFALTITATLAYLFSGKREGLKTAADWMLAFAAFAIIATIAAGFQAYYSVGHDGPSHAAMTTHRNWAVPTGISILLLALWRWSGRAKAPTALFKAGLTAAALSLSVTAWWGGHIVYNYGLGVRSLPSITGDGHDHDHGDVTDTMTTGDHDNADGHHDDGPEMMTIDDHDNADGHHDENTSKLTVPSGHDNSDGHHDNDTVPAETHAATGTALSIVQGFHAAMDAGDAERLKSFIAPDVIIAEGGGAERSLEEYAGHHMPSDIAFISAVDSTVKKQDVIESGDMATIITESQIHGTYKDKKIHSRMMETMVLKRSDGVWKITHIHWSSAEIKGEHEH